MIGMKMCQENLFGTTQGKTHRAKVLRSVRARINDEHPIAGQNADTGPAPFRVGQGGTRSANIDM